MAQDFDHTVAEILTVLNPRRNRDAAKDSGYKLVGDFLTRFEAAAGDAVEPTEGNTLHIPDVVHMNFAVDNRGIIVIYGKPRAHSETTEVLPLTYDPVLNLWFGGVDESIVPTPGQPLPRKEADVVLAETVLEIVKKATERVIR